MATISRFEDLEIWQLSRVQCQAVFELMEDSRFDFDAVLADQLNRSSGSVMDNIAEGFDRFTKADFRHFLTIARGSHAESRSQLYRARDRKYITPEEHQGMLKASIHLSVKISNLIAHLYHTDYKSKLPSLIKPGSTEEAGSAQEADILYSSEPHSTYNIPEDYIQPFQD